MSFWRGEVDGEVTDHLTHAISTNDKESLRQFFAVNSLPAPLLRWRPTASDIVNSELKFLHSYWQSLRSGNLLPNQRQVDPKAFESVVDYTYLLDVCDEGRDFKYRYYGTKVISGTEETNLGRKVSELPVGRSFLPFYKATYLALIDKRSPLITSHQPLSKYRVKQWLRIFLPLVNDTGKVSQVLVGAVPSGTKPKIDNDNFLQINPEDFQRHLKSEVSSNRFRTTMNSHGVRHKGDTLIFLPRSRKDVGFNQRLNVKTGINFVFLHKSITEVRQEIEQLSDADWHRLGRIANIYAARSGGLVDSDELLQEALRRVYEDKRQCPIELSSVQFISGILKSISYEWRMKRQEHPAPISIHVRGDGEFVDALSVPDTSLRPDEAVDIEEQLTNLFDLFKDRPEAQAVLRGQLEGLRV
jgi:hypothetical protein